jgi:outer membrane protein TolC
MFGFTGTGALALSLANEVWTASASAAQIAFDAGLRDAEVEAAIAAYRQSVAPYRQTILTAFQQVEDQLAAIRILARQQKVADDAVKAANRRSIFFSINIRPAPSPSPPWSSPKPCCCPTKSLRSR